MAATRVFHRNTCRLCDGDGVELVVKLKPTPLAEKYADSREAAISQEVFPVDLYMCRSCGHVQLLDVIDSDTLWDDYTYFSGQTKGIIDHFAEVAEDVIGTYAPPEGGLVVDIGSNDGSLLRPFKEAGYKVIGVDPARGIAAQATASGIPTIPELMTEDIADGIRTEHGAVSVVTAFNVFAHADNLGGMAESVKNMLAPDGVFVFECQYLLDIIDKVLLGTIFHEHMSHHSLKPMIRFLERHGLELIDVKRNSIQMGSIIGFAQHANGPRRKQASVAELLALEEARELDQPEAVKQFSQKLEKIRQRLAEIIDECSRTDGRIAGYGAARSGPTIVSQFGLDSAIQVVFDDHPMKMNKFTPGHGFKVLPTSELYKLKPDYVVILAWIHAKKIIANNQRFLEEGGKFVVCFPEVEVMDASSMTERKGECQPVG